MNITQQPHSNNDFKNHEETLEFTGFKDFWNYLLDLGEVVHPDEINNINVLMSQEELDELNTELGSDIKWGKELILISNVIVTINKL